MCPAQPLIHLGPSLDVTVSSNELCLECNHIGPDVSGLRPRLSFFNQVVPSSLFLLSSLLLGPLSPFSLIPFPMFVFPL